MKFFCSLLFVIAARAQTAAPPKLPATAMEKPAAPAKPVETFQSAMEKQRAAMAIQHAAILKQARMASEWQSSAAMDTAVIGCDPMPAPDLAPLIESASRQHQLEPKLLRGVIEQESGSNPCAVSPKGARGLMQLMPSTIDQFKVDDAFDPEQNIEAGATFLRQLLDKYKGDLKLALAAYNAGPATVDKAGAIPDIKETQDYVNGILKRMQ